MKKFFARRRFRAGKKNTKTQHKNMRNKKEKQQRKAA